MPRSTSARPRDTRRGILDAALDLFAEHGFHGSSMRALAGAVGVRESALYHHFPSKEAILAELVAEQAAVRSAAIAQELRILAERPLEEVLTHLVLRASATLSSERERKFLRFVIACGPSLPGEGGSPWPRLFEGPKRLLARLFHRLRRSGRIRSDVPLEVFLAHLLGPLMLASNVVWPEGKGPITLPLHRFLAAQVRFLAQALAPDPGALGSDMNDRSGVRRIPARAKARKRKR